MDCSAALEAEHRPVSTLLLAGKLNASRQSVRKHLLKLAAQGFVVYEAQERQKAWGQVANAKGVKITCHKM